MKIDAYSTPFKVQKFIKSLNYNREKRGATLRSATAAIRAGECHCLEASFIAAYLLEPFGYPPIVLDIESADGLDHVLFVFNQNKRWGSIGRSRDEGLQGRAPVFRTIRELAWSYFDPYVDSTGRLTGYQIVHLDETRSDWRKSKRNVWKVENYLLSIPHIALKSPKGRYEKLLDNHNKGIKLKRSPHWW